MNMNSMTDTPLDRLLIRHLRPHRWVFKTIATIVLVTFVTLNLQPLGVALAQTPDPNTTSSAPESDEAKLAKTILKIERKLEKIEDKLTRNEDTSTEHIELQTLKAELEILDQKALDGFAAIEQHLVDKNLPDVIKQRHAAAVAQYTQEMATLKANLEDVETATIADDKKVKAKKAKDHLKAKQKRKRHQPLDPNNLPFRTPKPEVRKPATSKEEFQHLGIIQEKPIQVAASELTPLMLAQAEDLPQPEHLQPTEDVQITQAIIDKAAELNNHPVEIYNWVRNNIEFLPTYGSIQGSNMTLLTKRGNAFDTASLLIALLRASNIPARYVYGTVEIPADQVMNWVGGVEKPEAAQQLLAQGGIPNTGLISGGKIVAIRMEHIWVEAWVDFIPSRGAKNIEGDTWVPMDGSFKRYEYTAGLGLSGAVAFDAEQFTAELQSIGEFNEIEQWVRNIDQMYMQQTVVDYRGRIDNYLTMAGIDPTVGELLGTKRIIQRTQRILDSGLSYTIVVRGTSESSIQASLRHKFKFVLRDEFGLEVFSFEESMPKLAGKKMALSFQPYSEVDEDVIISSLSDATLGTQRIVPGYLIQMQPEWTLDGNNVGTALSSFSMGTELESVMGVWSPKDNWQMTNNQITVGEYHAIGLDMQGIDASQLSEIKAELNAAGLKLEQDDLESLSKHDITGNMMQSGIIGYFATNFMQERMSSRASSIVTHPLPSYGTFSTSLETLYFFGIPRDVKLSGSTMDIDALRTTVVAKNNDHEEFVRYKQMTGLRLSAYEHLVPQKLIGTADQPVEGISAVKALSLAVTEGQRIYQVTANNMDVTLPRLNIDPDIVQEIRFAAISGFNITVSENNIVHRGWKGVGYIMLDPRTGSGAYKISGGTNGNDTVDCDPVDPSHAAAVALVLGTLTAIKKTRALGAVATVITALYSAVSALDDLETYNFDESTKEMIRFAIYSVVVATVVLTGLAVWTGGLASFFIPFFISVILAGLDSLLGYFGCESQVVSRRHMYRGDRFVQIT